MTMPSGARMPTMRSPGTAPPFGAKRTGVSKSMPRSGSASAASDSPGTRNTRSAALGKPNQPLSFMRHGRTRLALLLEVRKHGAHDVGGENLAAADANEDIVDRGARETRQRRLEFRFGEFLARALERALDDLAPEAAELRLRRLARRAADGGAGPARHHDAVPGRRRRRRPRRARSAPRRRCASSEISGAMRPLIFAPTAELPTSVWTA